MPDPVQILASYAQTFRIRTPAAPQASNPVFDMSLTPPGAGVPDIRTLVASFLPRVPLTETISGAIDLKLVAKNVRFVNVNIMDEATEGGMPVSDLILSTGITSQAIRDATNGSTDDPGVPGILGHLSGTVPIAVHTISDAEAPAVSVTATIRWRIRDESGVLVPVQWSLTGGSSGTSAEIIQPIGSLPAGASPAVPPDVSMTFPVLFTELVEPPLPLPQRQIEAAIRLEVAEAGLVTEWVELPSLTIVLPAIPVPRIAVFWLGTDFTANPFVVVPSGTPLNNVAT